MPRDFSAPADISTVSNPIFAVPAGFDYIHESTVMVETDGDFAVLDVVAGNTYVFLINGEGDSQLYDPVLELLDSDGNSLAEDDDSGPGLYSAINFTADTTETITINTRGFTEEFGGTFVLTIHENNGIWGTETDIGDFIATEANEDPQAWLLSNNNPTLEVNLDGLTNNGRFLAERALEAWSEVTGISFDQVSSGEDITFDDTTDRAQVTVSGTVGTGFGTGERIRSATVEVSDSSTRALNSDAFWDFLSGVGRALGLGSSANSDFINDSTLFTVMSDFNPRDSSFVDGSNASPTNLSQADLYAIQRLYETSVNFNRGATVYGVDSNVSGYMGDFFDEVFDGRNGNTYDGGPFSFTIMDTGGQDLLDVSNFDNNQVIDLRQGGISDIGGFRRNVVIAEQSGDIEDAEGGSGNDLIVGNGGNNELQGNSGRDIVLGAVGDDFVRGGGGSDTLRGGKGDDRVFGGANGDILRGGEGNDQLDGNDGNDDLRGGDGKDTMNGGKGRDDLMGGDGRDVLNGDGGDDMLDGGESADVLNGGKGNDLLDGGEGSDVMTGGSGNDIYVVDNRSDEVNENRNGGTDTIATSSNIYTLSNHVENLVVISTNRSNEYSGNRLDNMIEVEGAADLALFGEFGDDTILSGRGDDRLLGDGGSNANGGGDDEIRAGGGNDRVEGDAGNDRLYGDGGRDTILGGDGDDRLWGGGGSDNMNGDLGDDTLNGNGGNDRLQGRDGNDTLTGGGGSDTFVFDAVKNANVTDRITDYERGRDTIELERTLEGSATVRQTGGDTVLSYTAESGGAARTIILEDVSLSLNQIDITYV